MGSAPAREEWTAYPGGMQESTWRELAPGVYVRHHEELELNCGLVVGRERALVIDTRSTAARGRELAVAVREVTDLEQVVVNTHAHYDHCFGNVAFRESQIYAHADAVEDLRSTAEYQREQVVAHLRRTDREELAQTYLDTEVVLPFYLIEEDTEIDLGDRTAHLHHAGPGHTNHDLVVSVPDAGVVFWADLIEQGADPAMEDSYPLVWADTLRVLLERPEIAGADIHVPGHGAVVDTAFVERQQATLGALAAALAEGLLAGVRDVDALVAKTRGLGLQDATLRDAAVRALETGRSER
ncbi:MBL fold metallo-hydrolase [Ornithinicoccus hortensis]|uniref:Glyoxylase-like metal-dependent hydrolase (Beta-lactamase superfamily II) n=2 Tax=Ornithinicoccus hortensis TaxID=82346 RepID=A0A542YP41_9MICO|nr:glyoxylase-like metal-dependent hydrolase (beta-lactamase superfamily II) [Ornithinicoccus hortensis]